MCIKEKKSGLDSLEFEKRTTLYPPRVNGNFDSLSLGIHLPKYNSSIKEKIEIFFLRIIIVKWTINLLISLAEIKKLLSQKNPKV